MRSACALLVILPSLACAASRTSPAPDEAPRFSCRETTVDDDGEIRGVWRFTLDEDERERVGLHSPGSGAGVDMEQREGFDAAWRAHHLSYDFAADGTIDHVEETTFDDEGRPFVITVAYDDTGEAAWTSVLTYDDAGFLVQREETSRSGDRWTSVYENDAHGHAVVASHDWDGDGVLEHVVHDTWTYDGAGRAVRHESDVDDDGSAIETTTWTYDDRGRVASSALDSTLDGELLATFTHDGELLVESTVGYALDGSALAERTTYEYACE